MLHWIAGRAAKSARANGGTAPAPAVSPTPAQLKRLRAATDRQMQPLWLPRLMVASVEETTLPGSAAPLPARIYRPKGQARGTVLFLHGGGFVHCGLNSHDAICCRLARHSGAVVVSVDYRLAPDHRFPAAVEDGWTALQWVAAQADRLGGLPLSVAGDSAGGNLAAVLARRARDAGGPALALQLLYYPATHGPRDVPSRTRFAEGYMLTATLMAWYRDQYIDAAHHWESPDFAPYLASRFDGLAPAAIVLAEFDPLHDEGVQYAQALRTAGVPVMLRRMPGTIHGFLNFTPVMPKGVTALRWGAAALKAASGAA